ncbi:MAG: response regulator [Gemmatimonadales bacterium]
MDVLIVDDDQDIRTRYAKLLERAGYAVITADNGLAALAMLQDQTPRVILCDIQMAFLEGRAFYQELAKEHKELARRTVFISGAGDDPEIQAFAKATGRPLLTKPVDTNDLVAAVARVAEEKS